MVNPLRTVLFLMLCSIFCLGPGAVSASAHEGLTGSTPVNRSTLEDQPGSIELTFSGDVAAQSDGVRVISPAGERVDTKAPSVQGRRVMQAIASGAKAAEPGTYLVTWRVTSADGHTISGQFTYSVEQESESPADPSASSESDASQATAAKTAFRIGRGLLLIAVLVIAGAGFFIAAVAPTWRAQLVLPMLCLLCVAAPLVYVSTLDRAYGRSLWTMPTAEMLREGLSLRFGQALLLVTVLTFLAAGLIWLLQSLDRRTRSALRWPAAFLFLACAASFSLTGHASNGANAWARLGLDALHMSAAAVWIGGLLQLRGLIPEANRRVPDIDRFSRWAFASVVVLLLSGLGIAWLELGSDLRDAIETQYSRILIAKLVLYAGLIPLASLNRTTLVPAMRTRPHEAGALLGQYVRREVFLLAAIVLLTVWLIDTDPTARYR